MQTCSDFSNNPWLIRFKPHNDPILRLFCFPYAGGGAAIYRGWPNLLSPDIEICAVQPPGRGYRVSEPPFTNLAGLVEAAYQSLAPCLDRPFVFFGHSMGALLAFELAHKLFEEGGLTPVHLFLSAYGAPQCETASRSIYNLPEPEFIEELRKLNGTSYDVLEHTELMQLLGPAIRADFEVCQTYCYSAKPALPCSITALGGLQDIEVTREQLEGWREHTNATFSLRLIPGDHFFLHESESSLLEIVSQQLEAVLRLLKLEKFPTSSN